MSRYRDIIKQRGTQPATARTDAICPGVTKSTSHLASLLQSKADLDISQAGESFPAVLVELDTLLRSNQRVAARARFDQKALHTLLDYIHANPLRTDVMYVGAKLLVEIDQHAQAERIPKMNLDKDTHPEVLVDLVRIIRQDPARISEAIIYGRQAHDLVPDNLEYLIAYLRCVRDIGDVKKCVTLIEHAIDLAPWHRGLELQLLWNVNYLPGYDRACLFQLARQWAEKQVAGNGDGVSHHNGRSLTRKLKVGMVSGDFFENSAMASYEPALRAINRTSFELYGYSNLKLPDAGTDRYEAMFDVFRDVHELSDFELASQIRRDGIDILIVFGGQCQGNRLAVVTFEPAPIQVDWGGLFSLGLTQIGYRLTDAVLDPPEIQRYHVEELVYLPRGFVTFYPLPASPSVTALPAHVNGHITFGSFNNHIKINDQVLDMWAQILQRMPDARLLLKFPRAHDPGVRGFLEQRLELRGIDLDRIMFGDMNDYADHLRCLGQVDLLLDCYPFNGYRTALEGLWMGVPTVTLSGTTHVSRTGLAIMKQLGLESSFVAQTPQAYVDLACAWVERLDELARMRSDLRDLLLSSSICDCRGFARDLEGAFHYMWQQWCEKQDSGADSSIDVSALAQSADRALLGQAGLAQRSHLDSLLQGAEGLEISLDTASFPALLLEANTLLRSGQHTEARMRLDQKALQVIQDAVADDPSRSDIMYVAAKLLSETGQHAHAERFLKMILDRESHPVVLAELAEIIQQDHARPSEAKAYWQQACELAPDNMEYLQAYALCVKEVGDMAACIEILECGLARAPGDCGLEFQWLWNINYLPGYNRPYLFQRATQWGRIHAAGISGFTGYNSFPSLTKRLKIGIVSGDFYANSAMAFYEPALAAIDRRIYELYAYSNVKLRDAGTDRYEAIFSVFRDVHALSDQEIASHIHRDGVDILLAFGGQCKGHRIGALVFKPAPIQVDWGALCTLGIPQIDYRITDAVLDPPDMQPYHLEELVYLSGGFVTYRPPAESPPITPLPAQSNGYITFGSFNNHVKISDQVIGMWAEIMRRVPDARLVLKFPRADDPEARKCLRQRLGTQGIAADRIQFAGTVDYFDHLCLLGQVDLLLDCYPFNGYRTALEGLWMGVPTITLSGTTHVSRTGLAILKQLGLDGAFAAQTPQAYIERACAYAEQLADLACVRAALRDLLLSSSICDPARYARSLEEAFAYMWRQWCDGQQDPQTTETASIR